MHGLGLVLSVLGYQFRPVRIRSAWADFLNNFACRCGRRLLLLFGRIG